MPKPPTPNTEAAPPPATAGEGLGDIFDEIDAALGATATPAEGEVAAPGEGENHGPSEAQPIADALNISLEHAAELWEGSHQYGPTQGMSVDELAEALATDNRLLMSLEQHIAGPEEAAEEQEMFALGEPGTDVPVE